MRLVQFLQVVVLLALAAYVVLVQLENPLLVRLPLPGGGGAQLPMGLLLAAALLVGALYAGLLLLPALVQTGLRRRQDAKRQRELEARLSTTLQAKLAPSPAPQFSVSEAEGSGDEPAPLAPQPATLGSRSHP